jgi:hypothetical protein
MGKNIACIREKRKSYNILEGKGFFGDPGQNGWIILKSKSSAFWKVMHVVS